MFVYRSINNFSHIIVRAPNVNRDLFFLIFFVLDLGEKVLDYIWLCQGTSLLKQIFLNHIRIINLYIEKFIIFSNFKI